jgi:hypothetical protein
LFCESKTGFAKTTGGKADTGYLGIKAMHVNSEVQYKKIKISSAVEGRETRKPRYRTHESGK